ncbi:L-ascorbate oxidase homolog [Linum perenne]
MAEEPRSSSKLLYSLCLFFLLALRLVNADSPYRFYTWKVTYGNIYPLGVKQQVLLFPSSPLFMCSSSCISQVVVVVKDMILMLLLLFFYWQGILINGQFPGPHIDAVTNDNIVINVYNYIKEPFLLSWNGIQHRRNSWQDGVYGTNCPIRPGRNFTYILQFKDQIGTFFYFPSLGFHKAAGGFGSIRVWSRPRIPVPFPPPAGDFVLLAGDWYKTNHYILRRYLNAGRNLPMPDGLLINGRGWNGNTFRVDPGRTYRFRISNVGLATSINFRIQGHRMKLVEVEGSHTVQNIYTSLDVHLGQSYSVLVTADQPAKDYYIVVSTRFTTRVLTTTSILHYSNSRSGVSGPIPGAPTTEINWSLNQARTIRRNLTASGPRPNPQGSYHYGMIKPTRTITLANSAPYINGKQRYAVNSVSFVPALTPLKLADYFNIPGVFNVGSIPMKPTWGNAYLQTSVMGANFREYVEIIFQNWEDSVQSWHIDGHAFFVVGMDGGQWTPYSRMRYNLRDTVSRCTVQVYPRAWTAIYMALDNVGMWNIRSENWARQYLGQQLYLRVYSASRSWRDELPIPKNALLCGRARGRHTRPL